MLANGDMLGLGLAILLVFTIVITLLAKDRKREHFFNDYVGMNVSWSPVTAPSGGTITYTYYGCISSFPGACTDQNPANWGVYSGTTTNTTITLTSANCKEMSNGTACDFTQGGLAAQSLYFGIIATDNGSGQSSTPAVYTLGLGSDVREATLTLTDENGNSPPHENSKTLNVSVYSLQFASMNPYSPQCVTAVSITRGANTVQLTNPQSAALAEEKCLTSYSLADTSLLSFQPGDVITVEALVYSGTITSSTGIVNGYYGILPTQTVPAAPAPASPGSASFVIQTQSA